MSLLFHIFTNVDVPFIYFYIKKTQPQGLGFDLYQTPLKPLVAAPEAF